MDQIGSVFHGGPAGGATGSTGSHRGRGAGGWTPKLTLDHSVPTPKGELTLIALVTDQKGRALEDTFAVHFFQQGDYLGQEYTGEDGRAIFKITNLEPGTYKFEAAEMRYNLRQTKIIRVEGAKRSTPDKLEARALGRDGRYVITATVTDVDNRPVKGVLIEVYDAAKRIARVRTNADGVLEPEPEVRFTERWKKVTVQAPGFPSQELTLAGPRSKGPPPVPEPDEEESGLNPIFAFFRGIRAGRNTLKTRRK